MISFLVSGPSTPAIQSAGYVNQDWSFLELGKSVSLVMSQNQLVQRILHWDPSPLQHVQIIFDNSMR